MDSQETIPATPESVERAIAEVREYKRKMEEEKEEEEAKRLKSMPVVPVATPVRAASEPLWPSVEGPHFFGHDAHRDDHDDGWYGTNWGCDWKQGWNRQSWWNIPRSWEYRKSWSWDDYYESKGWTNEE